MYCYICLNGLLIVFEQLSYQEDWTERRTGMRKVAGVPWDGIDAGRQQFDEGRARGTLHKVRLSKEVCTAQEDPNTDWARISQLDGKVEDGLDKRIIPFFKCQHPTSQKNHYLQLPLFFIIWL